MFLFSIFLYVLAMLWQLNVFIGKKSESNQRLAIILWAAVLFHSIVLYRWIDIQPGQQNLSSTHIANLITWLSALLLLISLRKKPVANLFLIVCPLNVMALLAGCFLKVEPLILMTGKNLWQFIHVWIALASYSLILIAAVQYTLLVLQEHRLKFKSPYILERFLPPLMIMEELGLIWLGYGFYFLCSLVLLNFLNHPGMREVSLWKILFSFSAGLILFFYLRIIKLRRISNTYGMLIVYFALFCLIFSNVLVHNHS